MKYKIDYKGLEEFLRTLSYKSIKEGALTKAFARNDIERFYNTDIEKSKITLDSVIEYGQPFLVDAIGNDLSVCVLTRRKLRLPTGRVVRMKFDRTIIDDCRAVFGSPVNNYFVIPDRFIQSA